MPTPRKSVKQMVQDYEDHKPVPTPRTKIEQTDKALKGYTKSYKISIKNNKDPLAQMQNTRKAIEFHLNNVLTSTKGFKCVETLQVTFTKLSSDEIVIKTAYFNSKAQTVINHIEIHEALQMSKQNILNKITQWISEGSGWTIQSVDNHYLNIAKCKPMNGSSYTQLPSELRRRNALINIKNEDSECFRWCHIRHLNLQEKILKGLKNLTKNTLRNWTTPKLNFQ